MYPKIFYNSNTNNIKNNPIIQLSVFSFKNKYGPIDLRRKHWHCVFGNQLFKTIRKRKHLRI